jgi:hypothetical protein
VKAAAWVLVSRLALGVGVTSLTTEDVPDAGTGIRRVNVTGTLDAPAWAVRQVVLAPSKYPGGMPYLVEERLLGAEGCADGGTRLPECKRAWYYNRVDPPVISARDYTVRVELLEDALESGGAFAMSWQLDSSRGPSPRPDSVRMALNQGSWRLEVDGARTRFTYQAASDPGGAIPKWIAKRAGTNEVPNMLEAIERAAQNLARTRADGGS